MGTAFGDARVSACEQDTTNQRLEIERDLLVERTHAAWSALRLKGSSWVDRARVDYFQWFVLATPSADAGPSGGV